jgi:hypothetical protein
MGGMCIHLIIATHVRGSRRTDGGIDRGFAPNRSAILSSVHTWEEGVFLWMKVQNHHSRGLKRNCEERLTKILARPTQVGRSNWDTCIIGTCHWKHRIQTETSESFRSVPFRATTCRCVYVLSNRNIVQVLSRCTTYLWVAPSTITQIFVQVKGPRVVGMLLPPPFAPRVRLRRLYSVTVT